MNGPLGSALERAVALVRLFHADPRQFAEIWEVNAADLPQGPHALLAHASHMTLAMERFHGGPVRLIVAAHRECDDGRYAREILLAAADGRIVQYGIVRIDLDRLPAATAASIRHASEPLGRILVSAGLMCDVHDVALLRLATGPDFARVVGSVEAAITYGRVAGIGLEGAAVIELLEIVAPGTAG